MRAICLAMLLAGCAAQQAARMTSPALCYVNYAGNANDKAVSSQELAARRFTCSQQDILMGQQDYQAHMAGRQKAASDAAALYLMTRPPPPVTCSTTPLGSGYSTTTCR